jgi:hypothetical protein
MICFESLLLLKWQAKTAGFFVILPIYKVLEEEGIIKVM